MIARLADEKDLPKLVELGREFMTEGRWGWTYSDRNAARTFLTCIIHHECDVIVIDNDGDIVGAVLMSYENDFQVENVGDIIEFYISKRARGTGAGRMLLDAACEWFDKQNCVNVFVKATGNIEANGKSFQNLFAKQGFKIFSDVMVRGLKNE